MTSGAPHRPATATVRVSVTRFGGGGVRPGRDAVIVEEPMEIRVGAPGAGDEDLASLAVTMRTPGHDFELATGFLVTEGIALPDAIRSVAYCGLPPGEQEYNIVTVRVDGGTDLDRHRRNTYTTSSCGICGKTSIDAVEVVCSPLPVTERLSATTIAAIPTTLRSHQRLFDETGGLHAAAVLDATGAVVVVREDVGRHNAVDKVVGWAAQQGRLPLSGAVLGVSGRASFEIVQKAAVAGLPAIVAVSAPSSLAVAAAERLGVTLVGFARDGRFTVYAHPDRIVD